MGQPKVASATWRGQNRRISRDFYEAPGQQTWQTRAAVAAQARCHVKTLNCVLREAVKSSLKIEEMFKLSRLWDGCESHSRNKLPTNPHHQETIGRIDQVAFLQGPMWRSDKIADRPPWWDQLAEKAQSALELVRREGSRSFALD